MYFYKLTVEVPLFVCYFSFYLSGYLIINLNMYKVCYNIFKYPEANCSRLGQYTDNATQELEKIVQPYAGTITAVTEMVPHTVTTFLSLMIGSWSDKYGRKPVLLLTLATPTIGMAMYGTMVLFKEVNPWWLMVCSIPMTLSGGLTTLYTVILAYLNDTSTPENKAMRMVLFDIIQLTASLSGGLLSSYMLYATSYSFINGICSLLIGLSLIYTYLFCDESLKNKTDKKPTIGSVFTCNNIIDFKVIGKKREYNKRSIIFLIILALALTYFVSGDNNVKTLYLRNKFRWTLTKRNVFGAWSGFVGMACTFSGTYLLHKKLKIRGIILIILSLISIAGTSILYAIGNNDGYIYASVAVGLFSGIGSPMLRTMLADLLVPEEMGKVFSVVMVLNNLGMLVSSLSYQEIYNMTIDTHPEAFNYFSIGLLGFVMVLVIIIMRLESCIPLKNQQKADQHNINNTNKSMD